MRPAVSYRSIPLSVAQSIVKDYTKCLLLRPIAGRASQGDMTICINIRCAMYTYRAYNRVLFDRDWVRTLSGEMNLYPLYNVRHEIDTAWSTVVRISCAALGEGVSDS